MKFPTLGLLIIAVSFTLAGCGGDAIKEPDLGFVTGKVTLDGAPVSNVVVQFEPQGEGGASTGQVGSDGTYELLYKGGVKGAAIGTHTVRIIGSSASGPAGGETGEVITEIPEKYNANSDLSREVKAGDQVFDFELTSG